MMLFRVYIPHNGYTQSFTALLELLDNQRFARLVNYDQKQDGKGRQAKKVAEESKPYGVNQQESLLPD